MIKDYKYDYLIVGAGMFGSVFAREMTDKGKRCLIIDKRKHIGGNCYTENIEEINVHKYGAHIFHTNDDSIWEYINRFANFNNFINRPLAYYKGKIFSLPFTMMTLNQLWGVITPDDARKKIDEQKIKINHPNNLEEWAISQVGWEIYEKLIYGYTYKQWQREPKELPAFIIKRLPIRFTYDTNYFNDKYQGIPIGGYTELFKNILKDIDVKLNVDFFKERSELIKLANKIVYTGKIDEYYSYISGELEYRTLNFENILLEVENYQGNAVINYTDKQIPYTRIIEHKHFEFTKSRNTIITKEYPDNWHRDKIPYYPINDHINNKLFLKYKELANKEKNVIFGGRLAEYKYYDMHQIIGSALNLAKKEQLNSAQ